MRFSELLSHLNEVTEAHARDLAHDPEISGAEALDRAGNGQLSFLEPGNALAAALAGSGASAVLIPARGDGAEALQQQARERGLAWVAVNDPRLAFAEALDALHPRRRPEPGIHPSAVVDPTAVVGMGRECSQTEAYNSSQTAAPSVPSRRNDPSRLAVGQHDGVVG